MNKPAMTKAMMASISEVLEQMFFLPIDMVMADDGQTPKSLNQSTIAASVGFDGHPSGTFRLNIPLELATLITADFLGTAAEQLSQEQITDTVKEMINMLAGNSLSAYDAQSAFDLKIPELIAATTAHESPSITDASIDIGIETLDSCMTLIMTAQRPNGA